MEYSFTYRTGSVSDFSKLKELAFASYREFQNVLTPDNWEKLYNGLHNEERLLELIDIATVFVCEERNKMAGAAYFVPHGHPTPVFQEGWCYIRLVGVDPAYRGHGIAKKLTQLCIDHAKKTNETTLALHTSEFMDAARHIYETLGFRRIKEIDPIFGKRYWLYALDLFA